MPDVQDVLAERAELVAHACRTIPDNLLWGQWGRYDWHMDLKADGFRGGGTEIEWRHPHNKKGLIRFTDIRPTGELDNEKIEEIPVGDIKIIDGVVVEVSNWEGIAPLPFSYDAAFGKTMNKGEALAIGFKESVKIGIEFSEGGEAAFFKAKQSLELGFEASQDKTQTSDAGTSELRSAGISPTCPPAFDIDWWLTRTTQPTKMRVSGLGQLGHGIEIGKHWGHGGGHWKRHHRGHHGHTHYDQRHLRWDTWDDFLSVIKGEGRRDLAAAAHFKAHPAPAWLIRRLEAPLTAPYSAETPVFDGWTKLRPRQRVRRGPNPAIVKPVQEDEEEE